jgi:hypothetical protein
LKGHINIIKQRQAKNKPRRRGCIAVYFDQLIKQQFRFFLKKIGGPEKGRCLKGHINIIKHKVIA